MNTPNLPPESPTVHKPKETNRFKAFVKRRPGVSGAVGGIAAALLFVGGYTATACTCVTPVFTTTTTTTSTSTTTTTTTPATNLGGVTVANLWITRPGDAAGNCSPQTTAQQYLQARSCGGSNWMDLAVSQAAGLIGTVTTPTIGVPGGIYTGGKQFINFKSGLQSVSPACDPLGTWGSVAKSNCIRFAPEYQQQVYWHFSWENHASDIWIDGSSTGTVVDRTARTYSFKMDGINTEIDPGDAADGVAINHNTYTGFWTNGMYMGGCQHCRYTQGQVGPRVHVERAGMAQCPNGVLTVDGTSGTGIPNPSDATNLGASGVPTGYQTDGQIPSFEGRNNAHLQNDQVDNIYFVYAENTADLACDPHDGGLFLRGGIDSITLSNNIFNQNESYDIQVQDVGSQPSGGNKNVLLQNNWFGDRVQDMRSATAGSAGCPASQCHGTSGAVTPDGPAIDIDSPTTGWIVRYNSFSDTAQMVSCFTSDEFCSTSSLVAYGNTGDKPTDNGATLPCASITNGSPTITLVSPCNGSPRRDGGVIPSTISAGMHINSGGGIPSGTNVLSNNGSTITMTQNATATNTNQDWTFYWLCSDNPGETFNYNVWVGGTCGGTDTSVSSGSTYVDNTITGQNYALKGSTGSTTADDFVTNSTYKPSGLDSINGVNRSGNYDAGSWAR